MPSRRGQELLDRMWQRVEPLLPPRPALPKGGRPSADDRACFAGIVYQLRGDTPARRSGAPPSRRRRERGTGVGSAKCGRGLTVGLVTDARGTRVAVVTDAADVPETVPGPVALATPPAVATVPAGVPVVADRAYDSDPLRGRLAGDGSRLPAPHRATRTKPPTGDGRRMRRGKRRWVVGRTFAWLHADRRVVARFGREVESFDGFVHLACAFIALDQRS